MVERSRLTVSRRDFTVGAGYIALLFGAGVPAATAETQTLDERFDYLSKNGNSTCMPTFADSIAKMPVTARLRGSCCSEMERKRYARQVQGLTKYAAISEIPPDPYDIAAGVAQKVMPYYEATLSAGQQQAYQYAMDKSDEKGPCCCQCWRWKMYGGLAKFLIVEHTFSGEQVVDVWNLSNGCGGSG
ncbi:hypothetical protein [Mesorhizobium sp. M7A.F.Ca.US.008.03.1.1]|uniref:hypothetical protein n=1 Tax=Mesorhizobium sp. M7A.F.Ca.US.008.03.1.1 TaxID=2496742 RepID=UPI000FCC8F52|nr:hypothetical protein [Mesorhizobium sp. M7A.F.Ca.US.008.03.1.1]RUW60705.1 hypothetical protein EOA16_17580 [Mesorhizobium sp. M7A.F.Ca.US.008.03.1.1]